MEGQSSGQEEREQYRLLVRNTFISEDERYEFYNEYAKIKGFKVLRRRR
jgi:hypothetical protein